MRKAKDMDDSELLEAVWAKHGKELCGEALSLYEDAKTKSTDGWGMTEGQRDWLRCCYRSKLVESTGKPSSWTREWILQREPWVE